MTEAGRFYVTACRRILEQVGEAERIAAGDTARAQGELTLTAPVVFGRLHVLPVVSDFLKTYPEIDIRPGPCPTGWSTFSTTTSTPPCASASFHGTAALSPCGLAPSRRVACASADYLTRHGVPKTPADLAARDCVTFEGELFSPLAWTFGADRSPRFRCPSRRCVTVNTAEGGHRCAGRRRRHHPRPVLPGGGAVERRTACDPAAGNSEPAPSPVSLVHAGQGFCR